MIRSKSSPAYIIPQNCKIAQLSPNLLQTATPRNAGHHVYRDSDHIEPDIVS